MRLDPSVGGSGPHGLTVRVVPHVLRPNASIATRLTSGDEWPSRPPYRGGLASLNHKFCLSERDIFLLRGLDSSGKTPFPFFESFPVDRAAEADPVAVGTSLEIMWKGPRLFQIVAIPS